MTEEQTYPHASLVTQIKLRLMLREERPLSIAVTQMQGIGAWAWLPKSKIQFVIRSGGSIEVTLPHWLAKEKELI